MLNEDEIAECVNETEIEIDNKKKNDYEKAENDSGSTAGEAIAGSSTY